MAKAKKGTKPKIEMTWENIVKHNILTQTNVDILLHKARKKTLIGAKGSSKTYGSIISIIYEMTNDVNANAVVFKKFKTNASIVLAGYFNKAYNDLKEANFQMPEFRVVRNRVYCLRRSKSVMDKNTFIAFGSLEDTSGTSDALAPNYGYFSKVFIDEVLERKDLMGGKMISKERYDDDLNVITSNLDRHTESWNMRHPMHPREFSLTLTCNPWTDADPLTGHPEIVECEEIFPEAKFIEFVLGYTRDEINGNQYLVEKKWPEIKERLLTNTSMAIYHQDKDHLVVRNTSLNNPINLNNPERLKKRLNKIKYALYNGFWNNLTILLGFCNKAEIDREMLVYGLADEQYDNATTTLDELTKQGYIPQKITYSIDIDTSRVYTITPGVYMRKMAYFDKSEREPLIFIDKQIEIGADGIGEMGEYLPVYVDAMLKVMKKNYLKYHTLNNKIKVEVAVDDKRKQFLYEFHKRRNDNPFINQYRTFLQHGEFGIAQRQDWTIAGIENGTLLFHKDNKQLFNDMKVCVKANYNAPERQTAGKTNYLDRIDSMENAFISYVDIIINKRRNKCI